MNTNNAFKKWVVKTRKLYALVILIVIGSNLIESSLQCYHIWLECINLTK